MEPIRIIRLDDVMPQFLRGSGEEGGKCKKIIVGKKMYMNLDEVNPGFSPHGWHTHASDGKSGYPEDFEELYFIISGRGLIQWKAEDGEIQEKEIGPGDTISMPPNVGEHQLLNNGSEKIRLIVIGCPPKRIAAK